MKQMVEVRSARQGNSGGLPTPNGVVACKEVRSDDFLQRPRESRNERLSSKVARPTGQKTDPPDTVPVLVLEPFHDRPACGLGTDILVVLLTFPIIRIGLAKAWPDSQIRQQPSRTKRAIGTHSLKYGSSIKIML